MRTTTARASADWTLHTIMNYAQRKRFMKASWLAHFTYLHPGGVIVSGQARRREPGEAVLDIELEAMNLTRDDVAPRPMVEPEPAPPEPPIPDDAPTIPMARPAAALLLGYNPAEE